MGTFRDTVYIALKGIVPRAKFTLRPSLAFSYVGSVTAQHSRSAHQPNFTVWYKVWNYRTFAPHHFQQILRAAITLSIGPHSSCAINSSLMTSLTCCL